jgi:hypothetical protein
MSDTKELDPTSEWAIGAYVDPDGALRSYVATIAEETAAKQFAARRLADCDIRAGDVAVVVGDVHEALQISPFRDVLGERGAIVATAAPGPFGGSQLMLYAEDFPVAVVVGIDQAMADGLDDATIEQLRARPTVVLARPGAAAALRARGLDARTYAIVGPMAAVECATGLGAHFDAAAWRVYDSGDQLVVSSLLNAHQTDPIATDVHGTVDTSPCGCGSEDPKVVVLD